MLDSIKAFKKGMSEDGTAKVKPEPVNAIDHQSAQTVGQQTENRKVSCTPRRARRRPSRYFGKAGALLPLGVRMFDIEWSKLILIGVVVLIVIGPKELPGVLRAVGQWTGKIRRMATEFQGQFQEAMRRKWPT